LKFCHDLLVYRASETLEALKHYEVEDDVVNVCHSGSAARSTLDSEAVGGKKIGEFATSTSDWHVIPKTVL